MKGDGLVIHRVSSVGVLVLAGLLTVDWAGFAGMLVLAIFWLVFLVAVALSGDDRG